MYIIIVYDINVERVHKVHKFLKTYLHWQQNSVFEGEITNAQYQTIIENLKEIIDENSDSILIYTFPKKYLNKKILGIEKNPISFIF